MPSWFIYMGHHGVLLDDFSVVINLHSRRYRSFSKSGKYLAKDARGDRFARIESLEFPCILDVNHASVLCGDNPRACSIMRGKSRRVFDRARN